MQTLNNIRSGKGTPAQGIIGLLIVFGLIWGAIKVLNPFMADLAELMKNTFLVVLFGTPVVLFTLYCIFNPVAVWMFFSGIGQKITKFFVKMDPLTVMDRYVVYLRKKLARLYQTIEVLRGKKTKMDRKAAELQTSYETNLKHGNAARKRGLNNEASSFGTKAATDRGSLERLQPLRERAQKSLTFLEKLADNWKWGIDKLEYQIRAKRDEYEFNKEIYKGLKTAEDFINSDNEAARLYGMSVAALEEQVTQQIGFIDEFERKSKDIINAIDVEKQVLHDDGIAELDKFMNEGNLEMPDFTVVSSQLHKEPVKVPSGKSRFGLSNG